MIKILGWRYSRRGNCLHVSLDTRPNALAALSQRLQDYILPVAMHMVDDPSLSKIATDIDTAHRIIETLADADIDHIHLASTLPKRGRAKTSWVDNAVWDATDTVEECRAIAARESEVSK